MTKEMDCCTRNPEAAQSDSAATTVQRIRSWALSPQGLTITGIAAVVVGFTLSWSWVVALGLAPLILALGPCLVMCALGLCMNMRNNADTLSENTNSGAEARPQSAPSSVVQSPGN